ncbi:conserved hypothetical protein [Coccidioides posadasii str. Silveira]|uniref:Uncharacterized protein n=1 Tax=Coccidioides posadasii (strain RMSCC 757 / Silveira) TaxID=443226 RepID=E9DGC0_COCPS|nr:conserved hypothetical protein [Coccidioides posadasii str. Silveira]
MSSMGRDYVENQVPHLTSQRHYTEWGLGLSVSSKHLNLASIVFKQTLQGKFRETTTLQSTACVEIPLPNDDPEALTILLDICQVQMSNMPRTVSQRIMVQISCLVDQSYFNEVVLPFSDVWVDSVKPDNIECLFPQGLVELMAIYCCFNRPDKLREITQEAIGILCTNLEVNNLPIPSSYIDAINKQREGTISSISTLVQERLKYTRPQLSFYPRPKEICDFKCNHAQPGALVKVLTSLTFLETPTSSFIGYSISRLSHGLKKHEGSAV